MSLFKLVGRLNILSKLIVSFVATIIIPITISFFISSETASSILVTKLCTDTLNSLELVARSIENLQDRMATAAVSVSVYLYDN